MVADQHGLTPWHRRVWGDGLQDSINKTVFNSTAHCARHAEPGVASCRAHRGPPRRLGPRGTQGVDQGQAVDLAPRVGRSVGGTCRELVEPREQGWTVRGARAWPRVRRRPTAGVPSMRRVVVLRQQILVPRSGETTADPTNRGPVVGSTPANPGSARPTGNRTEMNQGRADQTRGPTEPSRDTAAAPVTRLGTAGRAGSWAGTTRDTVGVSTSRAVPNLGQAGPHLGRAGPRSQADRPRAVTPMSRTGVSRVVADRVPGTARFPGAGLAIEGPRHPGWVLERPGRGPVGSKTADGCPNLSRPGGWAAS